MTERGSLAHRLSLVVITDPAAVMGTLAATREALAAGAPAIQLRWKDAAAREMLALAHELRRETRATDALLFINDRLDVALAAEADGVHLGDDDLPLDAARAISPPGFLIGRSVDTPAEAVAAAAAGADYVGVGPVFRSPSKQDTGPVMGVEGIEAVRRAVDVPIVAIGGIVPDAAAAVIRAGADGIAVIGAVMIAENPRDATARLLEEIRKGRDEGGYPSIDSR